MERLYVDIETYSDLDLKKVGAHKYAADCELLLARFKLGELEYTYDHNDLSLDDMYYFPDWVFNHVSSGKPVVAHNAMFEYLVLASYFNGELTLKQMRCTQAKAQAHGLPGALAKATEALGVPTDKAKNTKGNALIRKFCVPRKPTKNNPSTRNTAETHPTDWVVFRDEYLYNDVEACEWLDKQLPDLTKAEQAVWVQTQRLNMRGVPIDLPMVKHIADAIDHAVDDYASAFIRQVGLFPTQIAQIVAWVNSNGVIISNLTADTVQRVIDSEVAPEHVKDALITRQNISHAAFKKYPAMINCCMPDNTVKGCFQYYAAHTGRYGGRLIQPHNFVRGHTDAVEAVKAIQEGNYSVDLVKSAVRGMVYHTDGFTIADYNAIEARVLLWLVNDQDGLDIFRNGEDPYKYMAMKIYEVEYDEVTSEQRFVGKQAVLGLGYQMAHSKFQSQATNYGVKIDSPTAIRSVVVYRSNNPKIVNFWATIQRAAKMALERIGKRIKVNKYISFERPANSLFLYMHLPSGRRIAYPFPEDDQSSFSYMGTVNSQWVREHTYGGKLTENAVQAIARDIMVDALDRMQHLDVVMHVHDEIVLTGNHIDEVTKIMEQVPVWAEDLPLTVEAEHAERFKKA